MADEMIGSNGPNGQNPQNDPNQPQSGWRKVNTRFRPQGGAQRDSAAVILNEWGLVETNAEATEMLDATAIARNIDPTKDYLVDYLIDDGREVVGVFATTEASSSSMTIRRYKNGPSSRISFHVGGAFAEAPKLRPDYSEVKCLVRLEDGPDGNPILVIPTKAGKATTTQSRGPGAESAASEDPQI